MNLKLWLCKHLGWHKKPADMKSAYGLIWGTCPVCGKEVILDSQGNWS